MKKTIIVLAALLTMLLSCGKKQVETPATVFMWEENDLKGRVKSVTTTTFRDFDDGAVGYEVEHYSTSKQLTEITGYAADGTVRRRLLITYNEQEQLVAEQDVYYSKGRANDTLSILNTYNDKGLQVKREKYHNGDLIDYTEKEYDDNGWLILNKEGNEQLETRYSYDEDGRIIRLERLYDRTVYEYDKQGKLTGKKVYENGSNLLLLTESFEYDGQGRLTKEAARDAETPSTLDYDKIIRYDEESRVLEQKTVDANGKVEQYTTYTYDEKGNMVRLEQQLDNPLYVKGISSSVLLTVTEYSYDGQGNWIQAVHNIDEAELTVKRKIEYYEQ